jgi:hypothetical protein
MCYGDERSCDDDRPKVGWDTGGRSSEAVGLLACRSWLLSRGCGGWLVPGCESCAASHDVVDQATVCTKSINITPRVAKLLMGAKLSIH